MWPDDDGGTGQVLGCFAIVGAIVGTVIGGVVGFVTDDAALKAADDWLILVAVPVTAFLLGIGAVAAWDAAVKRLTRIGSRIQDLREPGQVMTAILALAVPVAVAMFMLLVIPSLAVPVCVTLLACLFVVIQWDRIKGLWDVVK